MCFTFDITWWLFANWWFGKGYLWCPECMSEGTGVTGGILFEATDAGREELPYHWARVPSCGGQCAALWHLSHWEELRDGDWPQGIWVSARFKASHQKTYELGSHVTSNFSILYHPGKWNPNADGLSHHLWMPNEDIATEKARKMSGTTLKWCLQFFINH